MLKLIVDNTKKTCRNDCQLFDGITERCSIRQQIYQDNPKTLNECGYFLRKVQHDQDQTQLENINKHFFIPPKNRERQESDSLYPFYPDESANREDALWFVSPCKEYACWVINHSINPLNVANHIEYNEKAERKRSYQSPNPLHNHQAPLSLASKIAWYVNGDGYGKYVLLQDGKIVHISKER